MKNLSLLLLPLFVASPAFADYGHKSVHYESYCYKNVETYVPGYRNGYGQWVGGYVKTSRKRVRCGRNLCTSSFS